MTVTTQLPTGRNNAWQQLGTQLDGEGMTAEEAIEAGGLGGWNVRKLPLSVDTGTGERLIVPGRAATIRTNPLTGQPEVLGDVGDGYGIVQNEQHAEFLNTLVDESGASFVSAGEMKGGRHVFMSMRLPGHVKVGGVDRVDNYISAINSHDGSLSFTLLVAPIRAICSNILNTEYARHSPMVRIRHTSGAEKHMVAKVREALDITFQYLEGFQSEAEELINTSMTQARFEEIIMTEFGPNDDMGKAAATRAENRADDIIELFTEANTQKGIKDTAWAGYNALAEWADHFAPVRGTDDPETARAERSIFDHAFKDRAKRLMLAG